VDYLTHPQNYDGRIVALASLREFVEGREDRAHDAISRLLGAGAHCLAEAIHSPLRAGRIPCFYNAIPCFRAGESGSLLRAGQTIFLAHPMSRISRGLRLPYEGAIRQS
jgi:hypothetical protein